MGSHASGQRTQFGGAGPDRPAFDGECIHAQTHPRAALVSTIKPLTISVDPGRWPFQIEAMPSSTRELRIKRTYPNAWRKSAYPVNSAKPTQYTPNRIVAIA